MGKLSARDIAPMVAAARAAAVASMTDSKISSERTQALDYYLGIMDDMPAQEGRSRAVSTDVSDVIEGMLPQIMDILCGQDEVCRFNPVNAQDEQQAQQETDYVNHVLMQLNPGFMVIYSMAKDALLSKVGTVKVWWDTGEKQERETFLNLDENQFMMVTSAVAQSDGGLKIVEHTVKDKPDY